MVAEELPLSVTPQPNATSSSIFIRNANFEEVERIADGFFKEGKIVEAINIYQKMIEEGYSVNYDISWLGNAQHSESRYEWFIYRWYDEQRTAGKIKGNAFDALSLCFSIIKNSNEEETARGILWYEDMIGLNETVELLVGYDNILYNRGRYEEAIKAYNKAIEKQPSLINAYVGITMVYEFRRI
jgi:pentatricopeptide repeat protein